MLIHPKKYRHKRLGTTKTGTIPQLAIGPLKKIGGGGLERCIYIVKRTCIQSSFRCHKKQKKKTKSHHSLNEQREILQLSRCVGHLRRSKAATTPFIMPDSHLPRRNLNRKQSLPRTSSIMSKYGHSSKITHQNFGILSCLLLILHLHLLLKCK